MTDEIVVQGSKPKKNQLWKTIPGFAISAFFLWRTLSGIRFETVRAIQFSHLEWIPILVGALVLGYTVRAVRWWVMMRPGHNASFGACARVLLTSFAANNILPLRIGDFLRVFAYADDLNATPSSILGTVILERLLDMLVLLALLAGALLLSPAAMSLPVGHRSLSALALAGPALGVVAFLAFAFLFFAGLMERVLQGLLGLLPEGPVVKKAEKWLLLIFHAVKSMTAPAVLSVLLLSVVAWLCEGTIFVSAAKLMSLTVGWTGPWLSLTLSNLSYLIPSSPGAIGTFEYFSKLAMSSQGGDPQRSAIYGLLVHVIVFITVTGAGGVAFLVHRAKRAEKKA